MSSRGSSVCAAIPARLRAPTTRRGDTACAAARSPSPRHMPDCLMVDDPDDRRDRLVQARMKLRARFRADIHRLSDPTPMGTGPANRHGMPKLPIEQVETHKWPVLDLGVQPTIPRDRWRLTVDGACRHPVTLDWDWFMALPQVEDISDFHC